MEILQIQLFDLSLHEIIEFDSIKPAIYSIYIYRIVFFSLFLFFVCVCNAFVFVGMINHFQLRNNG